jgi:hypothetical protein
MLAIYHCALLLWQHDITLMKFTTRRIRGNLYVRSHWVICSSLELLGTYQTTPPISTHQSDINVGRHVQRYNIQL